MDYKNPILLEVLEEELRQVRAYDDINKNDYYASVLKDYNNLRKSLDSCIEENNKKLKRRNYLKEQINFIKEFNKKVNERKEKIKTFLLLLMANIR